MTTLVITRPGAAGQRFLAQIEMAMGGPVPAILAPLLRIDQIGVAPLADAESRAVILTSENAVAGAIRLGLAGQRAWCVGDRTAQVAKAAGFDAVSAGGNAAELVRTLADARPATRLIHVRGDHVAGDLGAALAAVALSCDEVVTYRQVILDFPADLTAALRRSDLLVAPLFSPRTAQAFSERLAPGSLVCAIALSAAVAARVDPSRVRTVLVADAPDAPHMVKVVCGVLGNPSHAAPQP